MKIFMLLMRGDQTGFEQMSEAERTAMIQAHIDYSRHLETEGVLVDGDGFSGKSLLLRAAEDHLTIEETEEPYRGSSEQLSGFYLIKVETKEAAVALAKRCPALRHGETVEVIELGH